MSWSSIFTSGRIGAMVLPNRLVMAAMETNLASASGEVTPALLAYYAERAAGGVGMVTVEFTCVDRSDGLGAAPQLSLDDVHLIAGHARLAQTIQAAGARACLQLHHAGRQTTPRIIGGRMPIAPSVIDSSVFRQPPRAMDEDDIARVIRAFGTAASYAAAAGYDAIELHGAHGYLLSQFLSPWTNRRDDAWGGDFERRLAFPCAVIQAVRQNAKGMPIIYRMSADEMIEGGLDIEAAVLAAPRLVAAGLDALHVSTGVAERLDANVEPIHMPEGWRLPLARRIRDAVAVPVIGVGVMRWPDKVDAALARGDADFIALGRALLVDPQWPDKARRAETADIRPCTSCNWCIDRLSHHQPIGCAENPRAGREFQAAVRPLKVRERAVVVGAGPGGLAAALMLDAAGFDPVVFERRTWPGGGLVACAVPPGKGKLFWYRDYLVHQVARRKLDLRMGVQADAATILACSPAVVIIATGAYTRAVDVPGAHLPQVAQAYDAIVGEAPLGPGPIVIVGGGETGCEAAELAVERGYDVVLVSRSPAAKLARSAESIYRRHLTQKIRSNAKIRVIDCVQVIAIDAFAVRLRRADASEWEEPCGQVLFALGRDNGSPLAAELALAGVEVAVIGDAAQISRIGEAVHGAYAAVSRWALEREHRPLAMF